MKERTYHLILLTSILLLLIWSAINPHDYFTWFLEVFPAIAGLIILPATYNRFRFSNLIYTLIWIHMAILIIGGHYTYAENPLFDWLQITFDLSRNYYDRLGHFAQGFIPVMIAREILLRNAVAKRGPWLFFLLVCIALSISAFYEFVEWWVAIASGSAAESFLATQGDVWDTQWDMFLAMLGALIALVTLSGRHDRELEKQTRGTL